MPRSNRGCVVLMALVVLLGALLHACRYWHNSQSPFTTGTPLPLRMVVQEQVNREVDKYGHSVGHWRKVIEDFPSPSLLRPAMGEGPDFAEGCTLPLVFYDPARYALDLVDRLMDGKIIVRTLREHQASERLGVALKSHVDSCSLWLPRWLAARADSVPPTRLDGLVYFHMTDCVYHRCQREFWASSRDSWRQMHSGRNPVSRLIAVDQMHRWAEGWEELLTVTDQALCEQNSLFHMKALHHLGSALTRSEYEARDEAAGLSEAQRERALSAYGYVSIPSDKVPLFLERVERFLEEDTAQDPTVFPPGAVRDRADALLRRHRPAEDVVSESE